MKKEDVDYSLYLVTDSTAAILGDRDLCEVVEAALKGGVTCVQFRDKTSDTGELVAVARRLHAITQRYNVPLLINDRVDVALAVGCEGVHIGQDDMSLVTARSLLGPNAIIGVTASTVVEAVTAQFSDADYLGIGTVHATSTKTNTKRIIGAAGVRDILDVLANSNIRTVCIGGINESNVQRVMFQSASLRKKLDGVAVVSAIVAAPDVEAASRNLLNLVRSPPPFFKDWETQDVKTRSVGDILAVVPGIYKAVHDTNPLSHNMTNLVVQNFAANVALAVGASPIMANYGEEARDLCKLGGALVINMGTVTPEGLENYVKALKAYNGVGQPVVLDPVGAGATAIRRGAVKTILSNGYVDVIKGNEGEIKTVFAVGTTEQQKLQKEQQQEQPDEQQQQQQQQRGVDSSSTLDAMQKAELVMKLAARERNVVVLTGASDFVSDGTHVFRVDNGHELLGAVTGTGCVLGTVVSAALAAARTTAKADRLAATLAGILHFEIAAELAAERDDVRGPGTFVPALIDELYRIRQSTAAQDLKWLQRAKVTRVVLI